MRLNIIERPTSKVWISMVDARISNDLRDLDHLDGLLWGGNPNTRQGDVVLMYRTAPYSDIAYAFAAASNPRPTQREDLADTPFVIELADKVRLTHPVSLFEIKRTPELGPFSFARQQRGTMRRRVDICEEGYWPQLGRLLAAQNPILELFLARHGLASTAGNRSAARRASSIPRLNVFISFGSEDRIRARRLRDKLAMQPGLQTWFDEKNLELGEWRKQIYRQIARTDVFVICLSSRTVDRESRRFFETEIDSAIEMADRLKNPMLIIPVKFDSCEVPTRLSRWQFIELFRRGAHQRLIDGLRTRANRFHQEQMTM